MEKKKQSIVSELQAIEERMKRNFDYKYGVKSQQVTSETQGTHNQEDNSDNSDHEEAFTETQIAVAKAEAIGSEEDDNTKNTEIKEEISKGDTSESHVSENGIKNGTEMEMTSENFTNDGQDNSVVERLSPGIHTDLNDSNTIVDNSNQQDNILSTSEGQEQ